MQTSNEGLVEIIGHEGISYTKYRDSVGVWTIGAGFTKTEIPDLDTWPMDKSISLLEIFNLIKKCIVHYENAINRALKVSVKQTQFDALVSWCYNVGVGYTQPVTDKKGNVVRGVATVLKLVNQGASGDALFKALLMYRKPPEIIGRRTKEARLLSNGVYSNDGKANLFPVSSKGYPVYSKGTTINIWQYIPHTSESLPIVPVITLAEEKQAAVKPMSLLQRSVAALTDYLATNK